MPHSWISVLLAFAARTHAFPLSPQQLRVATTPRPSASAPRISRRSSPLMYEPKNKRVTAEDLPNAEEIVVTYTATSSEKTLAPYDESEGGAQNIQTESSSALGALGATDSSDFRYTTSYLHFASPRP